MTNISVHFSEPIGRIKPMHSVNNGPIYKFAADQRITNMDAFRAAGIPLARTHDAAYCSTYGGEHTVDVDNIFPDFDADPEDPASYDFVLTDEYMRVIDFAGTKPYYRLGSKIEHWQKKYHTLPPKDFHKWAVVCEHIIRHLNEGWADGLHLGIEYWEIWNEPDLDPDDSTHKRCWGGTKAQFFELYEIAAKHLKSCFPDLKIGGPALAGKFDWARDFLHYVKVKGAPLDFFSYHCYGNTVETIEKSIGTAHAALTEAGFTGVEEILNEWNYVRGWTGDVWLYSLRREKDIKGSAFIASTMLMAQRTTLDHLMYYDARPCGMNGMFSTDFICDLLKGYYPFPFFNTLYRLGTECAAASDTPEVRAIAATGEERAVMISYFDDNDDAPAKTVRLDLHAAGMPGGVKVQVLRVDRELDGALVKEETFTGEDFTLFVEMPLFATALVKIVPLTKGDA